MGFVFELSHSAKGSYTSWLQVGGSDTNSATCTLLTSRLWRTMAPACPPPARLGGSCVTATPRRQDRWQGRARRRGDGAPRMPHSPAQWGARRPGGLTDTRRVDSASSVGGSRGRRPTRHSLGEHGSTGARTPPARPSPVALVQWAAKVAFFKLKLDQLMDSLCRVCLAESKQNLEDKRPDSHRGTCASPTGAPPGPQWTAVLGLALRPPVGTRDVHWRFANLDQLTLGESPGNAW